MNVYFNVGASFQNGYYAVDGINTNKVAKTGLKALFQIIKLGLSVGLTFVGADFVLLPAISN
jgi:hypothetical protein